jgi:hypothetical protein
MRLSTGYFATVIAFKKDQWKKTRRDTLPEDMENMRGFKKS